MRGGGGRECSRKEQIQTFVIELAIMESRWPVPRDCLRFFMKYVSGPCA